MKFMKLKRIAHPLCWRFALCTRRKSPVLHRSIGGWWGRMRVTARRISRRTKPSKTTAETIIAPRNFQALERRAAKIPMIGELEL